MVTNNYAFTWQPDVEVVVLGINDFSTSPNPSQAQCVGGYSNFVRTLRGHYPNADIICTYLSSMASTVSSYIQAAVSASGGSKVHFASVSYTLVNPTDLGSAWHPNLSGQTKIANAFIPVFDGIMGTSWGSAPHGTPLTWSGTTNSGVPTPFLMYRATNPLSPAWELISGSIPRPGNGFNVWTDSAPASGMQVFYRLAVPAR